MKYLIDERKKQYKANLHCHTILSDGRWTAEQVKEEYKKRGYSVVCITDHERLVEHHDLTDESILFLTGYELYIRVMPFDHLVGSQVHINLYSKTPSNKMLYYTPELTKYIPEEELPTLQYHKLVEKREHTIEFVQQTIQDAIEAGFLVCHNHPTWSFEDESVADGYKDCFAMEIYNHGCYVESYNEYNEHYYDCQLRKGRRMALIASDDNHNQQPIDHPLCDSFGGFTYILAEELEYGKIIEAMEQQDFYASTGPQIFSLTFEDGKLAVKTSNAVRIAFVTDTRNRKTEIAVRGEFVNTAEFMVGERNNWVRVEVTDERGCKAFTRAYFKEELVD